MPKAHLSADLQRLAKALKVNSGPIVDTSKWAGTVKGAGSTRPHLAARRSGRSGRVQIIFLTVPQSDGNCTPIGRVQLIVLSTSMGTVKSVRESDVYCAPHAKYDQQHDFVPTSSEAR